MKSPRPILHNRDHRRGGADAINGRWYYVGAADAPDFENSWANSGGTKAVARFGLDDDVLEIHGDVTGGVSGTVVFTLPASHRPAEDWDKLSALTIDGGVAMTHVDASSGEVTVTAGTTTSITTSTPTDITGILKGTGSTIVAATQGTDYYKPGGTDVAVADGGTGASTASGARTNLGLAIGTDVPSKSAFDTDVANLAAHLADTSDAHDASAISILDSANDFTATDVEGALAELQADAEGDAAALAAHLADSSDAHDASAISFSPTGTIAATDVQAAIAEVASEAGGSAAADISFAPAGTIEATDVQAAIEELAGDIGDVTFTPDWDDYTPTWTSTGTAPAIGDATVTARYTQVGKIVHAAGTITFGASSTFGSGIWLFALPATASTNAGLLGVGRVTDTSGSTVGLVEVRAATTTTMYLVFGTTYLGTESGVTSGAPWGWASGDVVTWNITYEAAANPTPPGDEVSFVAAGAAADVATTPDDLPLPFPAGLATNDLLLAQVVSRNTVSTITPAAGWTLLYGPDTGGGTFRQWIYYKFSDGTETGTETFSMSGSALFYGRMYAFRNVKLSSFNESGGLDESTGTAISCPSVTTSLNGGMAVAFISAADDNTIAAFTGETGGDYTAPVSDYATTSGLDGMLGIQIAPMASAGTVSGGGCTMSASDPWLVRAFGLKPA